MLVQLPLLCPPPSTRRLNLAGTDYQATLEGTEDWRKLMAFRLKQELAAGQLHQRDLRDSENMIWCKGAAFSAPLFGSWILAGLPSVQQHLHRRLLRAGHSSTSIPLTLFALNCAELR